MQDEKTKVGVGVVPVGDAEPHERRLEFIRIAGARRARRGALIERLRGEVTALIEDGTVRVTPEPRGARFRASGVRGVSVTFIDLVPLKLGGGGGTIHEIAVIRASSGLGVNALQRDGESQDGEWTGYSWQRIGFVQTGATMARLPELFALEHREDLDRNLRSLAGEVTPLRARTVPLGGTFRRLVESVRSPG
jgi:hypothetical protein